MRARPTAPAPPRPATPPAAPSAAPRTVPAERGTFTPFVAVLALGILVAVGLVADGGRVLAAHRLAADEAAAAARAGAQELDVDDLRRRRPRIDPSRAVAAARRRLAARGVRGSVRVRRGRVVVTAHVTRRTPLLALVGRRTVTVTATESARIVRGVTRGET